MTKITFIEANGAQHVVDARDGQSLMQVATGSNIPGIIAECGGNLSCSTCHGYIEGDCSDKVPPPSEEEAILVDCTIDPQPNSRLTCQVFVRPELDGLVVRLPRSQY